MPVFSRPIGTRKNDADLQIRVLAGHRSQFRQRCDEARTVRMRERQQNWPEDLDFQPTFVRPLRNIFYRVSWLVSVIE